MRQGWRQHSCPRMPLMLLTLRRAAPPALPPPGVAGAGEERGGVLPRLGHHAGARGAAPLLCWHRRSCAAALRCPALPVLGHVHALWLQWDGAQWLTCCVALCCAAPRPAGDPAAGVPQAAGGGHGRAAQARVWCAPGGACIHTAGRCAPVPARRAAGWWLAAADAAQAWATLQRLSPCIVLPAPLPPVQTDTTCAASCAHGSTTSSARRRCSWRTSSGGRRTASTRS